MRRATKIRLLCAVLLLLCGAYVARWAILTPVARWAVRRFASQHLAADASFSRLSGSLVDGIEVHGLVIKGESDAAWLRSLLVPYARVEFSLPALILGRTPWVRSVVVAGDQLVIAAGRRTGERRPAPVTLPCLPRALPRALIKLASVDASAGDQRVRGRDLVLRCEPGDGEAALEVRLRELQHGSVSAARAPDVIGDALVRARWDGSQLSGEATLAGHDLGRVAVRLGALAEGQLALDAELLWWGGVTHLDASIDLVEPRASARVHLAAAGVALEQLPTAVLALARLRGSPRGSLDLTLDAELPIRDPLAGHADLLLALHGAAVLGSPELELRGALRVADRELRIASLQATSGVSSIRLSELVLPLAADGRGALRRVTGDLVVDLSGLEAWSRAYFPDAPVALAQQGHLEVRAHARGGRLDLERARLSFGAARLALEPASLQSNDQDWLDSTLDVTIKSEQLSLAALTPAVDLPLNGQVEVNGRLRGSLRDLQGELQARIASLVLAEGKVLPVRQLEADVAGSLTLGGPLQSLRWTADLNVRHGSLKVAPQIPVITRISADLEASPASAILKGLEADLGGSALRIKGSLPMPWQHQRAIDLTVAGEDVLLTRANGLRARADVDLHLTGPLDRVHVGGTVLLRDGRFVRHVPLRPFAQHVPSPAATFRPFVIDHGLLQAWTFDVSVRTVEPFSVDNNLARGGVRIDLALAGTGAAPYFTGAVDFSAMRLTLPFTSFDVESGNLRFSERNPYDPDVLLVAHSRRRSIDIDLDVTGTWQEPQVAFASSPPLPSDDVLLLVTTGRLPDEFAGNAGKQGLALAGSFFGRELFAEMFASSSTEAQQDFFDRLAVEVGTETSSSGRENILIEYDLADPWYLQAERDVYNDYNIGVVYRIRFR